MSIGTRPYSGWWRMTTSKASHLRSLNRTGRLLAGVGARDALDARLIEEAEFDFVWASSFCISAAHCVPDSSILSMTQFLDAARSMNEAVGLPVVFDADTGYGNEQNVAYATKRIEEAGLAALCIEDKAFPKQSSLRQGARHDLLSIEEFTKKIEAAVSARRSDDFMVIARTEALIAGLGQEEALRRAHAYEEAGADCILLHSKSKSASEVVQCVRAWTGRARIVLVPTNYPDLIEPAIEELGKVGMVIYGNHCARAAVKAVRDVLSEMRAARGVHTVSDRLATVEEIFSLQKDFTKPEAAKEA
jgi:phosphoenolpyruvate phosphomutase